VSESDESSAEPTINAVLRAVDVLFCVAEWEDPSIGVTEVSDKLAVSKAVVYRLLSSLRAKGLVEMDESTHRYSLGPRVLALGEAYRARVDMRSTCRAEMEALVRRTDETATLSIRYGCKRTYIDQITPNRDVKMVVQIGQEFPLHAGASSKAFLAFLSPEQQQECTGDLTKLTELTVTSRDALWHELALIRERGYAVSLGERDPSAGSVAAPIFAAGSPYPVAVMSVCGPVERFSAELESIPGLLCDATRRVSDRLGHGSGV
jgi:IclR family transcriptional regulator, acetate operon repressor